PTTGTITSNQQRLFYIIKQIIFPLLYIYSLPPQYAGDSGFIDFYWFGRGPYFIVFNPNIVRFIEVRKISSQYLVVHDRHKRVILSFYITSSRRSFFAAGHDNLQFSIKGLLQRIQSCHKLQTYTAPGRPKIQYNQLSIPIII